MWNLGFETYGIWGFSDVNNKGIFVAGPRGRPHWCIEQLGCTRLLFDFLSCKACLRRVFQARLGRLNEGGTTRSAQRGFVEQTGTLLQKKIKVGQNDIFQRLASACTESNKVSLQGNKYKSCFRSHMSCGALESPKACMNPVCTCF